MDLHFATAWEAVVDELPEADAIVQGERRLTYADYDDGAARFAAAIEAAGVAPGSNVSLYLYNCPEYLVAQYGTFKHDCGPINVNYRYLDDELVYLVHNSDSRVLVFHTSLGDRVARVKDQLADVLLVEVDDGGDHVDGAVAFDALLADHEPQPRKERDPQGLYMLYTGGTTGMPKGVMYEQHAFVYRAFDALRALGLPGQVPERMEHIGPFARMMHDNARMVTVPCCPLMHGTGMWVGAMPPLLMGGTVVLLEGRGFDADELLDTIEREGVTRPVIVGDAFARPISRALVARDQAGTLPDLSSVDSVVSSGAMWSAETKETMTRYLNGVLIDALGSTEGGSYGRVDTDRATKGSTAKFQLVPTTRIIDEAGELIEPGSGKRGLLASETPARGYYKDPEKTARTFREIEGRWYVITGDWATAEPDGTITLHGRGSNCINSGGEKIFPEEVEEAIKTHPDIDDCYVIGVDDERFGQRIVAVAGAHGRQPTESELRDHVRSRLSAYKIPKQVVVVDEVRRAPNGKADYGWARELVGSQPATA